MSTGKEGNFTFVWANDTHYVDEKDDGFLVRVMEKIKNSNPKPDFVVIGGDVTEKGTAQQYDGAQKAFRTLGDIPLRVVIGNHDYGNDKEGLRTWEKYFGDRNYWFGHKGWQFVGLDTTGGSDAYVNTSVQTCTLHWVREHLPKLNKTKPTVILTHFPLAENVKWRPHNADELLRLFREYNLVNVFSGHSHGYTSRKRNETLLTTTVCCSNRTENGKPLEG